MTAQADYEDVEAPYSVSFKTSPGFEAAQLTIRGNDAEQLLARLDELNEAKGFEAIVDTNNLLQAVAVAALPEEKEEEKKTSSRSSSRGSSSRGSNSSRGGSSRGGSRGGGGNSRNESREIADEDLHPEGLLCEKRGCDGRVHYKEIENNRGTFKLWVCEFQRSKGDGHFSEFIND